MVTDWLQRIRAQHEKNLARWGGPDHDDQHENGPLAQAAACYAFGCNLWDGPSGPAIWPFDDVSEPRYPETHAERNDQLVDAGALILAELERRERAGQV